MGKKVSIYIYIYIKLSGKHKEISNIKIKNQLRWLTGILELLAPQVQCEGGYLEIVHVVLQTPQAEAAPSQVLQIFSR